MKIVNSHFNQRMKKNPINQMLKIKVKLKLKNYFQMKKYKLKKEKNKILKYIIMMIIIVYISIISCNKLKSSQIFGINI